MTDFDEFLRKRNEEQSAHSKDKMLLATDAAKEWQRLKGQVRTITEGKTLGTEKFEWSPYPAPYPEFLKLKDVAVNFAPLMLAGNPPQNFRIVFARRPLRANEVWSDDEPIPARNWQVDLEAKSRVFYWAVRQDPARRTTEDFASHIAQQLVEYYEVYTAALKAKYPWARF